MRRATILAALAFAGAVLLVSWRALNNLNVPGQPDVPLYALGDFRDAIYYPVVSLLDGNNPYDHDQYRRLYPIVSTFPLYSPLTLLVHLPLGFFDLVTAETVYYVWNVLLFLPIAALALRLCGIEARPAWWLGLAALLVSSRPGQSALFLGQYAPTMVLAAYAALRYARSRPSLAGLALALTTIKPTFGVPLVVLLLALGATRAVVLGVLLGIAGASIPLAILIANEGGIAAFAASTWAAHSAFSASRINSVTGSLTRIDLAALIAHWIPSAPGALLEAGVAVVVLGVAAVGLYRLKEDKSPAALALSGVIVCLATLGAVYHHAYDALLLAFPQVLMWTGRYAPVRGARRIALAVLLLVPSFNYLSSFLAVGALGLGGDVERVLASLNGLALAAALVICLTLAVGGFPTAGAPHEARRARPRVWATQS